MEVIPLIRTSTAGSETSNGDNGIKRHVQEWSRLDRLTGILEHARVEADQWTNHTANTKHKYGKVVDRRARNLADGTKEQTQQTKQLEVFQAHTAGCSVQVIRSQTSTTSSWHNSNLEYSPLDVSTQKRKASVARSGSIGARRPPTRRPYQQATAQLPEIESAADDATDSDNPAERSVERSTAAAATNLNRLKSCSNDEIRSDATESLADEPIDRSSRFRRSLQFTQSRKADTQGELEDVLKKVLGKRLLNGDAGQDREDDADAAPLIKPASPLKKPSFVTVETLNVTRNKLRHLINGANNADDRDDGIGADATAATATPASNTRSLEYRGGGGATAQRTEEWYDRRKSYGFEKVAATSEPPSATIDSSTDSGICRSTENGLSNSSQQSSVDRESIAELVKKYSATSAAAANEINNNNTACTPQHAYNTTVVAKGKILEAINSLRSKSSAYFDVIKPSDTVATRTADNSGIEDREQGYARRLSVCMDDKRDADLVPKRHSIAVIGETADKEPSADKKNGNKKVGFCRTEVHFDATPGKINIVDMEDKPAPTQLYRPKKRSYNRPPEKSSALPEYRFGDVVTLNGGECAAALVATAAANNDNDDDDDDDDNDGNDDSNDADRPESILKRQQQRQRQRQQQRQPAACKDDGGSGVASDNGIEVRISSAESTPVDCRRASWSVADRVRQVEAVGFSTRVNFTEGGETTAVGFDPTVTTAADPKKAHRYSYNGTASPVWYHRNGSTTSIAASATSDGSECHEKLLVRIGAKRTSAEPTGRATFSRCPGPAEPHRMSAASLVMNARFATAAAVSTEQPSTYLEEMNTKMQGRFQKAATAGASSWPRCGHKTYPPAAAATAATAARKYQLLKSCADIKRDRAAAAAVTHDVVGALDDLSRSIDRQLAQHVTLIEVRQQRADGERRGDVRGRLEYVKDLMSTDETSEESLKADEEVRSYMARATDDDDDDDDDDRHNRHRRIGSDRSHPMAECENLKKLISAVKKNSKRLVVCTSQDEPPKHVDVKPYEPSPVVLEPNVTSVLLNHEKPSEPERSQFQPVNVRATQVTVVEHRIEDVLQKPSKRVPVKIVQDNRKCKPKTEISKAEVPVTKMCATVSLKQVPMTVQPKTAYIDKKKIEKKESIYGNVGYPRVNSLRVKDKPTSTKVQDLFSTGRDSWLNMPKDLGPKLNKSKATTHKSSRHYRRETVDATDVSVLEELNRAADEILKAVNGYTDDESQPLPTETKPRPDPNTEAKLKNKKKAARLLQRANSREALLHLDEVSSSDEDVADDVQRVKPKMQRKTKTQQIANSVATKTTASFTKKIQNRAQNVTKTNVQSSVQHKVHPTYYGNVSSCTQTSMKFRNKPSDTLTKQVVDQKEAKGRYQCKITTRTFNPKKIKGSVEENKSSIKGC